MTVYVADTTWVGRYPLWADTPDEALMAAYKCGATMADLEAGTSWEHYRITEDQMQRAVANGATLTDRLGPVEWNARLRGSQSTLDDIARARAHGLPVAVKH